MQKPVLVIKLGTAVVTDSTGKVDEVIIKKLADEVAALSKSYRVALVSSGAVGSGKSFINKYGGTLTERKAAAAVGNPILIQLYRQYFSTYNMPVAQALCERHHFSNRAQFVQLKATFEAFWENNILPVVNENDLVSNVELKFSDNDELSALIAIGFDADTLIICTSAGGFRDADKNIIPLIDNIDDKVLSYISTDKSAVGLGGMLSKLTFTKLATSLGIRVIITGLSSVSSFAEAMQGNEGTTFIPRQSNLKARQKWLASGSITLGGIMVDEGAEKALINRKSLLSVGVKRTDGSFSSGEVVQLLNEDNVIFGVAKVKLDAEHLSQQVAERNTLVAHADDIVIF